MRHSRSWFASEAVAWMAVFLGSGAAAVAAPPAMPNAASDRIVLENEVCRYEIGGDGRNRALVSLADKKDYLQSADRRRMDQAGTAAVRLVPHGGRREPAEHRAGD